jgi:hypothetical protein
MPARPPGLLYRRLRTHTSPLHFASTHSPLQPHTHIAIKQPVHAVQSRYIVSMSSTTDSVATQLFARDPIPPLEPGKKMYDPKLTKTIASLDEHEYVKAGEWAELLRRTEVSISVDDSRYVWG